MNPRAKFCTMLLGIGAAAGLQAQLPIQSVTLYKNGVGYFVRGGTLAANATARLSFPRSQVSTVLASLVVRSGGGREIQGIELPAGETAGQSASRLGLPANGPADLVGFLQQVRGARLTLTLPGRQVSGRVLAAYYLPNSGQATQSQITVALHSQSWALLLEPDGAVEPVRLDTIRGLRLQDSGLEAAYERYLENLSAGRGRDRRTLTIRGAAGAATPLALGYLQPEPVWRSSYRLILDAKGGARLEAWALVENTSGQAWHNVRLRLVSGRPVSFRTHLYRPLEMAQPWVSLPEEAALTPAAASHGFAAGMAGGDQLAARHKATVYEYERMALSPPPPAPAPPAEGSSVAPQTSTARYRALFAYNFAQPVTIGAGQAAMLPFLEQSIAAQKILLYRADMGAHPRDGMELENNSGKTLDTGTVTIYDGGAYAGEAITDILAPGAHETLTYAEEPAIRVQRSQDWGDFHTVKITAVNGVLTLTVSRERRTHYRLRNDSGRARTLLIEEPRWAGATLLSPAAGDSNGSAYRFRVALPAHGRAKLEIRQRKPEIESFAAGGINTKSFALYLETPRLTAAARKQLSAVLAAKRELASLEAEIAGEKQSSQQLTADENRLRSNLQAFQTAGETGLAHAYANQLQQDDQKIAALESQTERRRAQQVKLRQRLDGMLAQLNF